MAIGTPVDIGHAEATAQNVNSFSMTTTAAVAAGDSIIVAIKTVSASRVLNSVTDSVGNTYAVDVSVSQTTAGTVYIASCHNATALPSGSTITATYASSINAANAIAAMSVSGLAHSSTLDKTSTRTSGASAAWSTNATATTTQAAELLVGVGSLASTAGSAPNAGYTELHDNHGTGFGTLTTVYQIVAATGTYTAGGTNSTTSYGGLIATYKGATSTTVSVGQASETDTAQPISGRKTRTSGQPTETDTAQPITGRKTRATGQATETDTAQPITPFKRGTVGQVVEADTAQPLTGSKTGQVAQAEEFDLARPIFAPGIVKPALETDEAHAITPSKVGALALAVEVDVAMAITPVLGSRGDGYTDAVVGIVSAPDVGAGIFTAPTGRN